jgi:hypothetical protein
LNTDLSDHKGPTLPCPKCGKDARYAGRHDKTFTTALGEMMLSRAYYHCQACEAGFCPRDVALGLQDTSVSPAVTRMVGTSAAMVSFAESSDLMGELAGVAVDPKQVERTAEALGRDIGHDERSLIVPEPPCASTMYLGMDGTGIPMRASELVGRQGKQEDGSSKTREVKLVTVWSAEGRDDEGTPVRDHGSVSYSAAIESAASRDTEQGPSDFAQRVQREAVRRGFGEAERRVILGDGAKWIWNIAEEQFPGAIQIVDRFHAKERLSDVAKAIHGAGSDKATIWAQQRSDELDAGKLDDLLAEIDWYVGGNDEARKCRDYLTENRLRIDYPTFHAQGLCTSTGVLEAGCKVSIGTRLKRAGMHWSVQGADTIIALRCCKLSGRFEDFWERRSSGATPTGT